APTFPVGVMYGPSGCGKSSLLKAGLLPRLAPRIKVVHVEATPDQTEARLMHELRRTFPALPPDGDLPVLLRCLRGGTGLHAADKLLIILDQFEQWLHGRPPEQRHALTEALRQCDGDHVQALLLVRDDFWLPVSRFMRDLEIPLVENQN